ncbi:hypothetical protein [Larkinella sp.]|uniref:hypothetical protein n=1 Tax=Larkinella sp. TaxID=2034517 RepID=UPI003BAC1564
MKKKTPPKPGVLEQKLLAELLATQPTRLGIRKSENLGFSDLPLFNHPDRQQNLFG